MARKSTKYIVIHCSQTRPSQNIGAYEINRWHLERGWLKIGYHKVIKRDGTIEDGREIDALGAHVKEYNHNSIGVCLVGGADENDWKKPSDNFTGEEWESLKKLLEELVLKYPEAKIVGTPSFFNSLRYLGQISYLINTAISGCANFINCFAFFMLSNGR